MFLISGLLQRVSVVVRCNMRRRTRCTRRYNSSPGVSKYGLAGLLAVLLMPVSLLQADSGVVHIQEQFLATQAGEHRVSLVMQPGDYIRGQINGDKPIKDAWIQAPDGASFRHLLHYPKTELFFQLVAESAGEYQLIYSVEQDTGLKINIGPSVPVSLQTGAEQALSSPRLQTLQQALAAVEETEREQDDAEQKKKQLLNRFWAEVEAKGTPLVEPWPGKDKTSLVTFLWRGAKQNVRLFGSPLGDHDYLERLEGTDVWFKSYPLPDDTRLSYKIAPDIPALPGPAEKNRIAILSKAQVDPLNKHPWHFIPDQDRFSTDSTLTLPGARPSAWLNEQGHPQGRLETVGLRSDILGNTRDITLYLPPGYQKGTEQRLPLLFFFDSRAYQSKVPVPKILDNLIAAGKIPPSVAVFVSNPSRRTRSQELPCNPDFADFMAQELLPWVTEKTGLNPDAGQTLLSGSSYGGLASTCVAFRYPEHFGLVLSLSGSFWWSPEFAGSPDFVPEWLAGEFAASETRAIRFYLTAGLFETGWQPSDILPSNRHFKEVLRAKGYDVKYREVSAGHDYFSWREELPEGLIYLLGKTC